MSQEDTRERMKSWLDISMKVIQFVVIPIVSYVAVAIADLHKSTDTLKSNVQQLQSTQVSGEIVRQLELEVSRITSNRFTTEDGMELWREIAGLKQEVAIMGTRPDYLAKELQRVTGEIAELRKSITARYDALEKKLDELAKRKD